MLVAVCDTCGEEEQAGETTTESNPPRLLLATFQLCHVPASRTKNENRDGIKKPPLVFCQEGSEPTQHEFPLHKRRDGDIPQCSGIFSGRLGSEALMQRSRFNSSQSHAYRHSCSAAQRFLYGSHISLLIAAYHRLVSCSLCSCQLLLLKGRLFLYKRISR